MTYRRSDSTNTNTPMPSQIIRFHNAPASRLKSVRSVNVEFGYWLLEQAAAGRQGRSKRKSGEVTRASSPYRGSEGPSACLEMCQATDRRVR
jgi:hypothetical protein